MDRGRLVAALRRGVPYLPALAASAVVGAFAIRAIFAAAHAPAAPLDDAFIHLNYAKNLAEGRFFSYVRGEGYSSGATSFLWPILLAPFHLLGLRGQSLVWATWLLGWLAHAATSVEVYRLGRRLAGPGAAAGAAGLATLFPAFAWFAWSGMETMALTWILLRTARVAAAYLEPERDGDRPPVGHLIALSILAPLVRPEGALASLLGAVALAIAAGGAPGRHPSSASEGRQRSPEGAMGEGTGPRGDRRGPLPSRASLLALAPLAGPLVIPLINLAFTGHAASSTTMVKWAIGNPGYDTAQVLGLVADNIRTLVFDVVNGGGWTWLFLPEGSLVPVALGFVALPIAGVRRKVPWHAAFIAVVALGVLIPCTYLSFLWNRVRYVWPFAGAWCVIVACLAREIGDLVRIRLRRAVFVAPLLAGAAAAAVGMRLPSAIGDLATSASAIQRQQVTLGHWAKRELPADARIGVNDTGAIAYFSGRRTFDVCGLTTEGEARYWNAGAGSRFEHYERLGRDRLPTHFIVYPAWMACPACLGAKLHEESVYDQSILGGVTMVAHEARWDLLGTGALPKAPPAGLGLVDEVDVSDLESEAAHGYEVGHNGDGDDHIRVEGGVADAGRARRSRDRFRAAVPFGRRATLVVRALAAAPTELAIEVNGRPAGAVRLDGSDAWSEPSLPLPEGLAGDVSLTVAARPADGAAEASFSAYHYWVYAAPSGSDSAR